jgi:hypothetical protein
MNGRQVDLTAAVAGALFVALGVAFLLDGLDVWEVRPALVLAVALVVLGGALVLGALLRRQRSAAP